MSSLKYVQQILIDPETRGGFAQFTLLQARGHVNTTFISSLKYLNASLLDCSLFKGPLLGKKSIYLFSI